MKNNCWSLTGINVLICTNLLIIILVICCGGCLSQKEINSTPSEKYIETNITNVDSQKEIIDLSHPATRIITTSTYATEYLIALGADDAIIGVNSNIKDNPLFFGHLNNAQIVGSAGAPDIEKIVSLHPDVVLLPVETSEAMKAKFRTSNLKTVYYDFYSLQAVPGLVRSIGNLTGNNDRAEKYLRLYEKYNAILNNRTQDIHENNGSRVYYEMSGDYSTSGKGSGGYNYLQKLKANNTAEDLPVSYPVVSGEWLIAENPDVIIKLCDQANPENTLYDRYDILKKRPELQDISAGKNNRTYIISTNILYGPRVIVGLATLGKILYPDKFSDIDPSSILDEYAMNFFTGANHTETVYPLIR